MLIKLSNWKIMLPLSILFFLFMLVFFPFYQSKINRIANGKVRSLDGRFSYSYEQVNTLFNKMGKEGRNIYLFTAGKIDMIYPIVYSLLFIFLTASLAKRIFPEKSKLIYVSLLPLLGMSFDYLENFNTLKLLKKFPAITPEEVIYGSRLTQTKWLFLTLSLILVFSLTITIVIKKSIHA